MCLHVPLIREFILIKSFMRDSVPWSWSILRLSEKSYIWKFKKNKKKKTISIYETDLSHPQQFRGAPGAVRIACATRSECINLRATECYKSTRFNLLNCPWVLLLGDVSYYKSHSICLCSTSCTPKAHSKEVQTRNVNHELYTGQVWKLIYNVLYAHE
jgi:hypothetical protein